MRTLIVAAFVLSLFVVAPSARALTCPTNCTPGTLNPNQCVDAGGEVCAAVVNSGDSSVTAPVTNSGDRVTGQGSSVTLTNPLTSGDSLEGFLGEILKFIIRIGTIVVILMVVYVGFKFVTAQGEPGKITEARTMLLWTVIGALVLLGAQAIAMAIQATVQALGG